MPTFAEKYGRQAQPAPPAVSSFAAKYGRGAPVAPVDDGEAGFWDRLKDTGVDAAKGVVGLGESAVGTLDLVSGNLIGKGLARIGYNPQRTRQILESGYSAERQTENEEVRAAEGFLDTIVASIQNPSVIVGTIIESSPMLLMSAGAVRAAATNMLAKKGLVDAAGKYISAEAATAGRELLKSAPVRTNLATIGAASEGIMGAGSNQEQARQAGRDFAQSAPFSVAAGVGTGVIGRLASRIPGLGDLETAVGTAGMGAGSALSIGKRIAAGMFQEGFLEEMPQSAQEQIFNNLALGNEWNEGVPEAAGTGLLAGAGMGGGFSAFQRRDPANDPTETINRIAGAETLDDAIAEADNILRTVTPGESIPVVAAPFPGPAASTEQASGFTNDQVDVVPFTRPGQPAPATPARTEPQMPAVDLPTRRFSTGEQANPAMRLEIERAMARRTIAGLEALPQTEADAAYASQEAASEAQKEADYLRALRQKAEQEVAAAVTPPPPLVRSNGQPFQTARSAEASNQMRNNPGAEVVPVEGGFGILPATQPEASNVPIRDVSTAGTNQAPEVGPDTPAGSQPVRGIDDAGRPNTAQPQLLRPTDIPDADQRGVDGAALSEVSRETSVIDATTQFETRQRAELQRQAQADYAREEAAAKIDAAPVNDEGYAAFAPEPGTLNIPRAEMPQVKAEHRGALVNFLNARGITHEQEEVPASSLKPTQAEFSPEKVRQAREFTEGDRAILVSSDGHIVDGHHQALGRAGENVRIIRLNAPIRELLPVVSEFPSAEQAPDAPSAQPATTGASPATQAGNTPQVASSDFERIVDQANTLDNARKRLAMKFGKDRAAAQDVNLKAFWDAKVSKNRSAAATKVSPNDSLTRAIAKLGGLGRTWMQDITGDNVPPKGFVGLFQHTGTSPDDMARKLVDAGYVVGEYDNSKPATTRPDDDMRRMLKDEISGRKKHYQIDSTRAQDEADAALQSQYQDQADQADYELEMQLREIAEEHGQDAADQARQYHYDMQAYDATLAASAEAGVESQLAQEREDDNEARNQAAAEADAAEDRGTRDSPAGETGGRAGEANRPAESFDLNTQSEESLRADADRKSAIERAGQVEAAKADADAELPGFTLSGSNSKVDQAEARGQGNMFDAPAANQDAVRDATSTERELATKAPYALDLNKNRTGWKEIAGANNDSVTLVSEDGKRAITFRSTNTSSGTESRRTFARAQAYAIDNPYQIKTEKGELVSQPIFQKAEPAAPLFSQSWLTADTSVTGMTVADVTAAIEAPMKKLKQQFDLDVVVLKSPREMPELADMIDPKKRIRGAYHQGVVYLFADNLQSARGAQVTLAHELIGHKGVLEAATPAEWGGIKATIDRLKMGNKAARDIWAETQRRYPDASAETQYKEFLAIAAEKRELKSAMPRLWGQIRATLRRIFKALGFNQVFSDSDLEIILSNSERYLRGSGDAMQSEESLASQEREEREGAESKGLPMDKASRMARAESMGFDTSKTWYHGTNADISEFDRKATVDGGFHFGSAKQANMRVSGAGKNLMPVYLAVKNPRRSKDMGGKWKSKIASAKSAGHDGIVYLNRYEGISLETIQRAESEGVNLDRLSDEQFKKFAPEAQDSMIAFEPNQIRSINAAFDPDYSASADLLASKDDSADSALSGQPLFSKAPQTDTPAFKKWFGDSKVVDEKGEPLVVYHGGADVVTDFTRGARRGGDVGLAFFTDSIDVARSYAETGIPPMHEGESESRVGGITQAYLSIKKPVPMTPREFFNGDMNKAFRFVKYDISENDAHSLEDLVDNRNTEEFWEYFTDLEYRIPEVSQAHESLESHPFLQYIAGLMTGSGMKEKIMSQYDGMIFDDAEAGGATYITFRPEQIKSAIGNRGTFSPDDPNILFSQGEPSEFEEGGLFMPPAETLTRVAVRKMQDTFKVLKDLQANIREEGGKITDENDTYLAEELFHGKAENDLRIMRDAYVEPLAEKMAKFDISREQLDQYLYARHAKERNAHIATINPKMQDGGSGMKNAEADQILAAVKQTGKQGQYDQLAAIVDDMLSLQRDMILKGGLEDDGTIDAWEAKYQHYVPLKGWAEDTKDQGKPRTGTGFNIRGKESKRALGRESKAASPVSYAVTDLTEKIIRRRKNEVGNSFLQLVLDNPNPGYWNVYTDKNPAMDRRIVKTKDPETGEIKEEVKTLPLPMNMMPDRFFATKKDGKTHYIKLEDERLMIAMKKLGPQSSNIVIKAMGAFNRIMSALYTSYAPEFLVSNFTRDIQTAILNLQAEQSLPEGVGRLAGKEIALKTIKDIPVAMRAVYTTLRGEKAKGGAVKWQQYFKEFREDGAKTGYFDMKDLDGVSADMDRLVAMAQGGVKGNAMRFLKESADFVEHLNSAVENAVRLSMYVNARNAGVSRKRAASLAKNATINFNRRGEVGTTLNALYLFANASLQGTANFARTMTTLKDKNGGLKWGNLNNAQKLAIGIAAGAYFLAMANRAGAGDDDDGENWYDKVPQYVKERNLVIMKSLFGGEQNGEYWKIPLPYGYNVFYVLGETTEAMLSGAKSGAEAATDLTMAALGSFSPIGYQDSNTVAGAMLKNAAPTVMKPVVELAMNENFMGSTIFTENLPFGTPSPDSSLGRQSTPEIYKKIATWLNETSGGSEFRSGDVDVNPDVMQYLVEYFGGSAYAFFASKLPEYAYRKAAGMAVEPGQTPFLSRVSGRVLPYEDMSKFYDRRDTINQVYDEYRSLPESERIRYEDRDKLQLRGILKNSERQLAALRKQRDRIYNMSIPVKVREERLTEIERRMKVVVDRFNRRYAETE